MGAGPDGRLSPVPRISLKPAIHRTGRRPASSVEGGGEFQDGGSQSKRSDAANVYYSVMEALETA
jgi:hypothetical protein